MVYQTAESYLRFTSALIRLLTENNMNCIIIFVMVGASVISNKKKKLNYLLGVAFLLNKTFLFDLNVCLEN